MVQWFNGSMVVWGIASVLVIIVLILWQTGGFKDIASTGKPQLAAAVAANLSSADSFAILADTAITNTGPSVITGDVGLGPTSGGASITGLNDTTQVSGTIYAMNSAGPAGLTGSNPDLIDAAKTALVTAYDNVAGQPVTTNYAAAHDLALVAETLTPGVYHGDSSLGITGKLTLDAQGDPNAVFIFQANSTLITEKDSEVILINGAQACNVFWQVGSSATLKTSSIFKGNILALESISLQASANVSGRLLARNGAVTLITNTVAKPPCTVASTGGGLAWVPPPATINVVKTVVNDGGGTKTTKDFPLFVGDKLVLSGVTNTFHAPTYPYVVSETSDPNYTQTFSGDCNSKGEINLNPGDHKFCIITNNDIGPSIASSTPPLIDVVKVPNPLALPDGPGSVIYTYTLRNIGTVPVINITMVGDTCSPITLTSGDTNGDSKLDLNEIWTYHCTTTLSKTHTNTVTATGWANGISAVDVASATVVVGAPIVPPLIHVTKVPSPLKLVAGSGTVTYTEKISNPGTVALSNVRLTDDKCSPMKYISGDTNGDSKLDTTETWTYTCKTNLTKTTTNTAIASGEANDLTARDLAVATVIVSVPGLPNTGLPPEGEVTPIENVGSVSFRLKIPTIGVDADVESVGLTSLGTMDIPKNSGNVAWFESGPRPGENGNAVVAGHFGWKNYIPAVFDNLNKLRKGDEIYVDDEKGATTVFVVREIRTYSPNENASEVFNSNDQKAHLNLVTCGGVWNEANKSYSERLVVFADKE